MWVTALDKVKSILIFALFVCLNKVATQVPVNHTYYEIITSISTLRHKMWSASKSVILLCQLCQDVKIKGMKQMQSNQFCNSWELNALHLLYSFYVNTG